MPPAARRPDASRSYAVVIDDADRLLSIVRCSSTGVYVLVPDDRMPRADRSGYSHASHHVGGIVHIRSRGTTLLEEIGPALDESFTGAVRVFGLTITPEIARDARPLRNARQHDGIVKLPAAQFTTSERVVSVDVVTPGHAVPSEPFCEIVSQHMVTDLWPPTFVTLWKPIPPRAPIPAPGAR